MKISFDNSEIRRYARHLILPEFNIKGQRKLKESRVLVVGAGGLGSPILLYLAAAGIGTIGIIDYDKVDLSNLQRQILFNEDDINLHKSLIAKEKLKKLNHHVNYISYETPLSNENAMNILESYDVIIDATDNFPIRYLINDACVLLKKPLVYGSIYQFEGQVSVFNYHSSLSKKPPCYRCLYPNPPPADLVPNCQEGGVLGVLPGIIGCIQANETIKLLASIGDLLIGRLFILDALSFNTNIINFEKDSDCLICSENTTISTLQDYDFFCSNSNNINNNAIKEIIAKNLKQKLDTRANLQLIDVREQFEQELSSIGGELIPISYFEKNIDQVLEKIAVDKEVIFYCRDGSRSKKAILLLEREYGLTNLYNLYGGLQEWSLQVDDSVIYY